MSSVGAIVLAAGGSTRLGSPKQLVRFRGKALVRRSAEVALTTGCWPVVVVLGAEPAACAEQLRGLPVEFAFNAQWRTGLASSIRAGLDRLENPKTAADAALLLLCDQPLVSAEGLRKIIATHRTCGAGIVASAYAGALGAPALFHSSFFDELRALRGDQGARSLFARFPADVAAILHAAAKFDLDTPADLERLAGITQESRTAALMR